MEQNFEQNFPVAPLLIGFILLMALVIWSNAKLTKRKLRRQGQLAGEGNRIFTIEERIAGNPAWTGEEIRSTGGLGYVSIPWLVALVWNTCFGSAFLNSFSNPEIKTGGVVVLGIFALLGLVPIGFAIHFTIRHFRFGSSWCKINEKAGVLGKLMSGKIRASKDIKATGDFTIELQCIETYSIGTGKQRRTETIVHWQNKQTVSSSGKNAREGIPFAFKLSDNSPETGDLTSRGDISWYLRMHAPVEGVDYATMFIVPVFRMEEPA